MARVTEIAPDTFQITEFMPELNMQFNHFLVRDQEPLLFHTGFRRMFPAVREAVATLIDPSRLRWISFSHFESDECGSLNEWLTVAPQAEALTGFIGAYVNLADFALRQPRAVSPADLIETGSHRFRFLPTAHVPHGWDSGVLFDESNNLLFCSDLFHQNGDLAPFTSDSIMEGVQATLHAFQATPFAGYVPFNEGTNRALLSLAELKPRTLAAMHGSTYIGDGAEALRELAVIFRQELGESAEEQGKPQAAAQQ